MRREEGTPVISFCPDGRSDGSWDGETEGGTTRRMRGRQKEILGEKVRNCQSLIMNGRSLETMFIH